MGGRPLVQTTRTIDFNIMYFLGRAENHCDEIVKRESWRHHVLIVGRNEITLAKRYVLIFGNTGNHHLVVN